MKLKELDFSKKLCISLFIVILFVGILAAIILLNLASHKPALSLLSPEDVKLKYGTSSLEASMMTSMADYVASEDDVNTVSQWIQSGTDKSEYISDIKPILQGSCVMCHNSDPNALVSNMPLATYNDVMEYTEPGLPARRLAAQIHYHLFGIGTFLLIITILFTMTSFKKKLKHIFIITGFTSLLMDFLSLWFVKYNSIFAYSIWLGGILYMSSICVMLLLIFYDMWFTKKT